MTCPVCLAKGWEPCRNKRGVTRTHKPRWGGKYATKRHPRHERLGR